MCSIVYICTLKTCVELTRVNTCASLNNCIKYGKMYNCTSTVYRTTGVIVMSPMCYGGVASLTLFLKLYRGMF